MKISRIILITLVAIFTINMSSAQVTLKVYPTKGVVVAKIHNSKVIVHKKVNYYYADGVWYNGTRGKYLVVGAPKGVTIKRLPRGYKVVRVNGRKYYKYRGVLYKKHRRNYVVVTV
jgi:hypothetical protein